MKAPECIEKQEVFNCVIYTGTIFAVALLFILSATLIKVKRLMGWGLVTRILTLLMVASIAFYISLIS